jgi:transcription elongation factor Elf1
MQKYLGDAVVTLDCPECSTRTKVTVRRLQSRTRLRCRECGSWITADAEQLRTALAHFAAILNSAMAARVDNGDPLESLPVLVTH